MKHNYPAFNGLPYSIMQVLRDGPMTSHQVAEILQVGPAKVTITLQSWIERGWVTFSGHNFGLTPFAERYFGGEGEDKPAFVGVPATSCLFNMMTRPPYKAPRTYRREGPEWAQRPAGFGFKSAMGAKEVMA